jgi:hypothetical protein
VASLRDRPPDPGAGGGGERDCALFGEAVPTYWRGGLEAEALGPCLIEEVNTVTVVPDGAAARLIGPHLVVAL